MENKIMLRKTEVRIKPKRKQTFLKGTWQLQV